MNSLMVHISSASEMDKKLNCKTCNVEFSGFDSYETHMSSVEHARETLRKQPLLPQPATLTSSKKDFCIDPNGTFHCNVCDIFVTGHVPFEQHMIGQKHLKKLRNREYLQLFTEGLLGGNSNESPTTNDTKEKEAVPDLPVAKVLESPDGKHDTSDSSEKSSLNVNINLTSTPLHNSTRMSFHTPIPQSTAYPYRCEPCGKSFTGVECYQQHVDSVVHFKTVNRPTIGSMLNSFHCDICAVSLSGPIPYQQHMDSPKHAKQVMKRSSLQDFCYRQDINITCVNKEETPGDRLWKSLQLMSVSKPQELASESGDTMDVIDAGQPFVLGNKSTTIENGNGDETSSVKKPKALEDANLMLEEEEASLMSEFETSGYVSEFSGACNSTGESEKLQDGKPEGIKRDISILDGIYTLRS